MFPGAINPARNILKGAFSGLSGMGQQANNPAQSPAAPAQMAVGNMQFGQSPAPTDLGNFQIAGGSKKDGYVKLNSDQAKAFSFLVRMKNAEAILRQKKYSTALQDQKSNILSGFGSLGRYFNPPDYKVAKNAADDWINAMLRRDSGAQISASEYSSYVPIFIPLPNDGAQVTAMKKKSRESYMFSLKSILPKYYQGLADKGQGQQGQGQMPLPPMPGQPQQGQQGQGQMPLPPMPGQPQQGQPQQGQMPLPPMPGQPQQAPSVGASGLTDAELLKSLGLN